MIYEAFLIMLTRVRYTAALINRLSAPPTALAARMRTAIADGDADGGVQLFGLTEAQLCD